MPQHAAGRPKIQLVDRSFRLAKLDMSKKMRRSEYEKKLEQLQFRLRQIQQAYLVSGHRAVIVFEGWDAGGKGGTIRRMASVLDPRGFKVWPIGAPRQYYEERHYLHRFWERLPPRGGISAFDRSWYGRVLVERVEGFAEVPEWRHTSTKQAPWHLVPANDKKHARIRAMRVITSILGKGMDLNPPPLHAEVESLAREMLGDSVADGFSGNGGRT